MPFPAFTHPLSESMSLIQDYNSLPASRPWGSSYTGSVWDGRSSRFLGRGGWEPAGSGGQGRTKLEWALPWRLQGGMWLWARGTPPSRHLQRKIEVGSGGTRVETGKGGRQVSRLSPARPKGRYLWTSPVTSKHGMGLLRPHGFLYFTIKQEVHPAHGTQKRCVYAHTHVYAHLGRPPLPGTQVILAGAQLG